MKRVTVRAAALVSVIEAKSSHANDVKGQSRMVLTKIQGWDRDHVNVFGEDYKNLLVEKKALETLKAGDIVVFTALEKAYTRSDGSKAKGLYNFDFVKHERK